MACRSALRTGTTLLIVWISGDRAKPVRNDPTSKRLGASMKTSTRSDWLFGLRAGSYTGGLVLVTLYALGAPTEAARQRVTSFVIDGAGVPSALFALVAAAEVGVLAAGASSPRSLLGGVVSALLLHVALMLGVFAQVVPEMESLAARVVTVGCSATVAAALLVMERARRERRSNTAA